MHVLTIHHLLYIQYATVRGMSRLLGSAMSLLVFALVFALAELHNMSQGSSRALVQQQHPVVVCVLQLAVDK